MGRFEENHPIPAFEQGLQLIPSPAALWGEKSGKANLPGSGPAHAQKRRQSGGTGNGNDFQALVPGQGHQIGSGIGDSRSTTVCDHRDAFPLLEKQQQSGNDFFHVVGVQWNQRRLEPVVIQEFQSLPGILAGNQIHLVGWRKLKQKRGGKAVRWTPRIREFSLDDFSDTA